MKKLLLVFGILTSSLSFAQQEFKLDIGDALIIKSLEVSYERYFAETSSFGVSALFNLEKQDASFRYNENIMITPYYRHYFTSNKSWNIFGEGFVGINSGKKEEIKNSNNFNLNYTDAALGLALGTKYIATGGLVIEAHGGLGRNLSGNSDSPELVPRIGLNVGWRF